MIFLPYLTGERTPYADPHARGAFVGLTVRHGRGHLVRAVMEGVAFGLRDGYELMRTAGVTAPEQIRASGGGTKSDVWRQIVADVIGAPLTGVTTEEGAAFGAAVLAGSGAGWANNGAELSQLWAQTTTSTEISEDDYSAAYEVYRRQYPLLRDTFTELGDV